ncbi:MAG: hypothetical protein ABI333_13400 [bacterium]
MTESLIKGRRRVEVAVSKTLVQTYWEMGRRLLGDGLEPAGRLAKGVG